MLIDQPERLRIAASMDMKRMPLVFNFIEQDSVLARCGAGTPIGYGSNAVSGETTPPGGTVIPPGAPVVPPPAGAPVVPPPPEDPDVSNS